MGDSDRDTSSHADCDRDRDTESGIDEASRAQVTALLAGAGLDPPAAEIDRLAALYPGLRRSIDRFHDVDAGDGVTAAVFRAGLADGDAG